MSKKLLTAGQLARELRVGTETIENWGRSGKIPRIRISHKIIRFDRDDVLRSLSIQGNVADNRCPAGVAV